MRLVVLTISDSSYCGERADVSGPALRARAEELGWTVDRVEVLPDEVMRIAGRLKELADVEHVPVVLTTGGTGVAARDVTPEATRMVMEKEIPGLGELMRWEGRNTTPFAVLSRSMGAVRGRTLVVNLPGSPKGAVESLNAIVKVVPHIVDLLEGRTGH